MWLRVASSTSFVAAHAGNTFNMNSLRLTECGLRPQPVVAGSLADSASTAHTLQHSSAHQLAHFMQANTAYLHGVV